MALGPQHYEAMRESLLRAAEDRIDAAIKGARRSPIYITFRQLGIQVEDFEQVIRPKYLAAGWSKARFVSDQRDGDYIILE